MQWKIVRMHITQWPLNTAQHSSPTRRSRYQHRCLAGLYECFGMDAAADPLKAAASNNAPGLSSSDALSG
jgi:hypothetical protein